MPTEPYTPNPANAADIYAAGTIEMADDDEPSKADNIKLAAEPAYDLIWSIIEGGLGDGSLGDVYIIGNGTPPTGGYTPATRPIKILGAQGLQVETLRPNTTTFSRMVQSPMVQRGGTEVYISEATLGINNTYQQCLSVPHGAILTKVVVRVNPDNNGLDPDTRVSIKIIRKANTSDTSIDVVPIFEDPSSSEATHLIEYDLTGELAGPRTIDNDGYQYMFHIVGEQGADASTVVWHGTRIEFTLAIAPLA